MQIKNTLELIERGQKNSRPSLLFIHGAFHNAHCWDAHYLPYFAERGWHAAALSLRGHGASAGNTLQDAPGLDDYLDDILHTIDAIAGPVILIGHSMGGVLCQRAYDKREAVKGVALLASSPLMPSPRVVLRLFFTHPIDFIRSQILGDMDAMKRIFSYSFFPPDMPAKQKAEALAMVEYESPQALKDVFPRPAPAPKSRNIPFFVLHGLEDWSINKKTLQKLARHFEATYIEAPGAHDVMLDPRWPANAAALENWLTENFRSPEN